MKENLKYVLSLLAETYVVFVVAFVSAALTLMAIFGGEISIAIHWDNLHKLIQAIKHYLK